MCKRSLSLMIAAALFGAGAVAAQDETPLYQRSTETPPPAAAASMHGQTHVPDQAKLADERCADLARTDADFDHAACLERERAQAALEDRDLDAVAVDTERHELRSDEHTVVRREAGFEADPMAAEDDFDEVRTGELAGGALADDDDMAMDGEAVAMGDGEPEVREVESDPFTDEAGSEGFSSGATASAAEREFERLGGGDGLSREQVEGELAQRFDEYDINDDGRIAENEFQSWFAASRAVESAPDTGYAASDDDAMAADEAAVAEVDDEVDADTRVDVDTEVAVSEDDVDVDVDVDRELATGDDEDFDDED